MYRTNNPFRLVPLRSYIKNDQLYYNILLLLVYKYVFSLLYTISNELTTTSTTTY